jgi:hypothetical protein
MSINKKVGILTAVAVVLFAGWLSVVAGQVHNIAEASQQASAVTPDQCQYPNRPLVNGKCDNSDPAVPECIKAPDEAECARNYNKPVESAPAPSPAPTAPANKCGQ